MFSSLAPGLVGVGVGLTLLSSLAPGLVGVGVGLGPDWTFLSCDLSFSISESLVVSYPSFSASTEVYSSISVSNYAFSSVRVYVLFSRSLILMFCVV